MSLIWHIVRKDCRRIALAVAVWSGLVALWTLAFARFPVPLDLAAPGSMVNEEMTTRRFIGIAGGIFQFGLGVMVLAQLVQQDRLLGTTAFWFTRPVSGGRLLLAKMLSVLVLFVLVPIGALSVVWLALGFTAQEIAMAALEQARWLALYLLFAWPLATLAKGLGEFVAVFTGTLAVAIGTFLFAVSRQTPAHPLLGPDGVAAAVSLFVVVGFVAIVMVQYLWPRRRLGWRILTGVAIVFVGGCVIHPWFLEGWGRHIPGRHSDRHPLQPIAGLKADRLLVGKTHNELCFLSSADSKRHEQVIPVACEGHVENVVFVGARAPDWGSELALDVLAPEPERTAVTWAFRLDGPSHSPSPTQSTVRLDRLRVFAMSVRPEVLGRLPMQKGAELKAGGCRMRVLAVRHWPDRTSIVVEQVGAWNGVEFGYGRSGDEATSSSLPAFDVFVVEGADHQRTAASRRGTAMAFSNSVAMSVLELNVVPPVPPKDVWRWAETAVLIPVRFAAGGREDAQSLAATEIPVEGNAQELR